MEIRNATANDLGQILALGKDFGHQMLYQKDPDTMLRYIEQRRVIVATDTEPMIPTPPIYPGAIVDEETVVGYYHYIVSGDPGFVEMLRIYRQMPENIIGLAEGMLPGRLCVMMQGGCHRDAFAILVKHLQTIYPEIWSWNSISNPDQPSSKIQGYRDLGFVFEPVIKSRFFNLNKGDYSTYMLGYWNKPDEPIVHGN
jgi:hypothetical protein